MPSRYEEERAARDRARAEQQRARDDQQAWDDYYAGLESGTPRNDGDWVRGMDETLDGVPIVGMLTGSNARQAQRRMQDEQRRQENFWARLGMGAPSAEDLTPEYALEGTADEYGDLLGGPSQLEGYDFRGTNAARSALENIMNGGGYTAADRAQQVANQQMVGQQMNGANQAALANLAARGMAGGGSELAARLSASQGATTANVMGNAAIQQAAMQRLMQATGMHGQLGLAADSQELARRQAIDAYNRANTDWRRGRTERNTAWQNRQADAGAAARQQAYQNRERQTAGITGQYNAGAGERMGQQGRQDQADQAGLGFVGGIIEGLTS